MDDRCTKCGRPFDDVVPSLNVADLCVECDPKRAKTRTPRGRRTRATRRSNALRAALHPMPAKVMDLRPMQEENRLRRAM